MTIIHASEVNYNILTAEQFVTDYADQQGSTGAPNGPGPILVLTNDSDLVVAAIQGDNAAMLAELVNDLNDYAKATADPGPVEAKVGSSSTVLPQQ